MLSNCCHVQRAVRYTPGFLSNISFIRERTVELNGWISSALAKVSAARSTCPNYATRGKRQTNGKHTHNGKNKHIMTKQILGVKRTFSLSLLTLLSQYQYFHARAFTDGQTYMLLTPRQCDEAKCETGFNLQRLFERFDRFRAPVKVFLNGMGNTTQRKEQCEQKCQRRQHVHHRSTGGK